MIDVSSFALGAGTAAAGLVVGGLIWHFASEAYLSRRARRSVPAARKAAM